MYFGDKVLKDLETSGCWRELQVVPTPPTSGGSSDCPTWYIRGWYDGVRKSQRRLNDRRTGKHPKGPNSQQRDEDAGAGGSGSGGGQPSPVLCHVLPMNGHGSVPAHR